MLHTEREKLFSGDGNFISLGITKDGKPMDAISVPWESTANAFSMRLPSVYITPDDLYDEDIMQKILSMQVVGCYVFTALFDYSFISNFKGLTDLNIYNGKRIENLDFLLPLENCRLFFLDGATLENIDPILDVKKGKGGIFQPFTCVGLHCCRVDDISRFSDEKHSFTEFIVWGNADKEEKKRWRTICTHTYRYYEVEN